MSDWESIAYSMQEKVKQLQQEKEMLEARVGRLEQVLTERDGGAHDVDCKAYTRNDETLCKCGHNYAVKVLNESPQQSLVHIKADAVDEYSEYIKGLFPKWGKAHIHSREYANQLRQQVKG